MIKRCFTGLTKAKLSTLYTSIIRPVLKYALIIWIPWLRKDISALDSVQRKCEKLCTEKISFEPLSKRRNRFDLIETYKFVKNKYKTDPQSLFSLPYRTLHGHKDKIFKLSARTDIQKQFFSHRVVDSWNLLSSKIIEADTVDSFRRRLMLVQLVVPSGKDDLSTK